MTIYVKFDIHIREISIYAKYTKQRQEADGSPPGAKGHAGWEEGGIVWEHGEHLRGWDAHSLIMVRAAYAMHIGQDLSSGTLFSR